MAKENLQKYHMSPMKYNTLSVYLTIHECVISYISKCIIPDRITGPGNALRIGLDSGNEVTEHF